MILTFFLRKISECSLLALYFLIEILEAVIQDDKRNSICERLQTLNLFLAPRYSHLRLLCFTKRHTLPADFDCVSLFGQNEFAKWNCQKGFYEYFIQINKVKCCFFSVLWLQYQLKAVIVFSDADVALVLILLSSNIWLNFLLSTITRQWHSDSRAIFVVVSVNLSISFSLISYRHLLFHFYTRKESFVPYILFIGFHST